MKSIQAIAVVALLTSAFLLVPSAARAQYRATPFEDPAIGEAYHVEASGDLWNPAPQLTVSSESLGIIGSKIDAVNDLGVEQRRLKEMKFVIRAAKKHKFRIAYVPITYTAQTNLQRDIVFNGQRFSVNLPVASDVAWKTWLFGYEYDFITRDRWFVGFVAQAKLTDVSVNLISQVATEEALARAPIPNLGGIGRVYIVPAISVTGEFVGIKLPDSINEDYRAHYWDFDLYGTVNFNRYAGAQIGYRSIDVGYTIKKDQGVFLMKGLYFGGVVRY